MIKVLIADDEEKVCQLIAYLVDWGELDMEIVAFAHNGIEAIELVEQFDPFLVITDIRMPGVDGMEMIKKVKESKPDIEFIVISGYRYFEYAQQALQHGVKDYLLKPIQKKELHEVLLKIQDIYKRKTQQISFETKMLMDLENSKGKVRINYLATVLFGANKRYESIEEINQEFKYSFQSGLFQIVLIKLDGVAEDNHESLIFLKDKIEASIALNLKELCYDSEIYIEGTMFYVLMNYAHERQNIVTKKLKVLLSDLELQESIVQGLKITIGVGETVQEIGKLIRSKRSAVWAIEERLIKGSNRMIEGASLKERKLIDTLLFQEFNQKMEHALEFLDVDEMVATLRSLKQELLVQEGITGHEVLQMTKEACNLYLFHVRNQQYHLEHGEDFMSLFCINANNCATMDDLFILLMRTLKDSLTKVIERRKQEGNRPIRLARQFMKANYQRPLTLEEVSVEVGFSPSYFSILFKKETGQTYLEYLSEVRMDQAKKLLKKTDLSVANVCQEVGYTDVKHFTKSFSKFTGLKPTQYRKLYS